MKTTVLSFLLLVVAVATVVFVSKYSERSTYKDVYSTLEKHEERINGVEKREHQISCTDSWEFMEVRIHLMLLAEKGYTFTMDSGEGVREFTAKAVSTKLINP